MVLFKLLVGAVIFHMLQAQENGPGYVNIVAGQGGMQFVHPATPAGINDGTCLNLS